MNWTWLIILIAILATHGLVSAMAILQVKRFWGLNRRNRRMSFLFAFTVALLDVLILVTFFKIQN